jgi:cell division protein FtsZ
MEEGGVKGARGVLINITGSSRLSLHDVNEACSLIRAATANEDAQINFGVVLNESMKDEVKITVIATGFQRDNLPQLARRVAVGAESIMPEPAFPPPAPIMEPVMSSGSLFRDMSPPPPPAPVMEEQPPVPVDDLEVPAFLRRERRLYQ